MFGNVNLKTMKQEKLNYLEDHQETKIEFLPLDSPGSFDVNYLISESFEDLYKFKSLQKELKTELLSSLNKHLNLYISSSISSDDDDDDDSNINIINSMSIN